MNGDHHGLALLGLRGGPLLLASGSPRRRELLERMRIPLRIVVPDVPEGNRRAHESPADYVARLAREKAEAALALEQDAYACLAADTVVDLDDVVLEKPADAAEADRFLERMGNRWHTVWTGLHLVRLRDGRSVGGVESSRVFFAALDAETRRLYIETGEPMDKAGGYGIQGYGGLFVPRIEGDYFNVMGLPLALLRRLCHELEGRA